jgi:hypothetical protein
VVAEDGNYYSSDPNFFWRRRKCFLIPAFASAPGVPTPDAVAGEPSKSASWTWADV